MIFNKSKPVGIVSYGASIPKYKIYGEEIAKSQGKLEQKIYKSLGVESKTVPGIDEDTITISTAAGFQALERLRVLSDLNFKADIEALFIGSESHPYAVKPSGTVVAQALGIASDSFESVGDGQIIKPLALADLQFACKAGTQAIQISSLYVNSGFSKYAMAIGADTAQARPGDVLEYTAGAGGGAIILGLENKEKNNLLAKLIATTSVATDTPDFWRRPYQAYPEHAGRFTANPGYLNHIFMAAKTIMDELNLKPKDFDYCVFHTPNTKFPNNIAKKLGFTKEQIEASLVVKQIGNTYAGASILGLISTLDIAKKNKKVLVVSYGSGSGSDAFVFETTKHLELARKKWEQAGTTSKFLEQKIKKLKPINYEEYRVNSTY